MIFEELKVTKVIRWIIPELKVKNEERTSIKSNVAILSHDQNVTSWYMKLYPNGERDEAKENIGLFLFLESAKNKDFFAKWSFTLQNEHGSKVRSLSDELNGQEFESGYGYGFHTFISHQELSKQVKDCSRVTIICEVYILKLLTEIGSRIGSSTLKLIQNATNNFPFNQLSVYGPKQQNEGKSSINALPPIQRDLKKMFESEMFCDLDIKTNDGVILKAHKNILSARSPVLLKMLTTEMETNSEEINEFDSITIRELLRFIYCEEVNDLGKNTRDLIYASDFYEMTDLKEKCIEEIASKVSEENVVEALIIADRISGAEKLTKACVPIISICLRDVSKNPKWTKLSKDMLQKLMIEIWETPYVCDV